MKIFSQSTKFICPPEISENYEVGLELMKARGSSGIIIHYYYFCCNDEIAHLVIPKDKLYRMKRPEYVTKTLYGEL